MIIVADEKDIRERQREIDAWFYRSRNPEGEEFNASEYPL
jgi:hypothetical protein